MALIRIQNDPHNLTKSTDYTYSGNLLDWLIENQPEAFDGLHAMIFLNGREIANTSSMPAESVDDACDISVGIFDSVVIVLRPQGVDPISWYVIAAIIVASVTVGIILANMIPDIPDAEGADGNNQLNSSSNSYRPFQAIPEIFGSVVSFPDFVQPSYYIYNANGKRIYKEVMCIGNGQYDVSEFYDGDSPFSDIEGASATVYEPGDTVPDLQIVKMVPAALSIDLSPPDEVTASATINNGSISFADSSISISSAIVGDIALMVGNTVQLELYCYSTAMSEYFSVFGAYTVSAISGGTITFSDADWLDSGQIIDGSILNENYAQSSNWYTLEGDAITEVRFHVIMPGGIRAANGSTATVTATLSIEYLDGNGDPTGTVLSRAASFTGKTLKAQARTFVIDSNYGLATPGRFRAKASRVTNSLGDGSAELMQLERLESVTPYTADFGDVTMVVVDRITPQSGGASRSSSKISSRVTRKLRIYDNSTGIYGASYVATRRFCDAAFYLLYEVMQVPIEYIDTDALFGIHDNLSDAQLGYFDYTFDDANVSARDRLKAICNSARVVFWNDGLTWTFERDQAKPVKSALFSRRNLKSASAQFVQSFRRPADYDSVIVKYVDPEKNTKVQVARRITGGSFVNGQGVRPLEIDLIGCSNTLQATNRAELEVRRLAYQRVTVTDTALNDALLLRKLQRVDWVDIYDSDIFDGEVISVSGNQYKTSERFTPASGAEYWVYITDQDGNVSNSVRAYARADGDLFGFQADGLTGVYIASGVQQLGSRYFIASNDDLDASSFIVDARGRPNELGECEITLLEYNEQMYEMD